MDTTQRTGTYNGLTAAAISAGEGMYLDLTARGGVLEFGIWYKRRGCGEDYL
jgi:hypothetical protein